MNNITSEQTITQNTRAKKVTSPLSAVETLPTLMMASRPFHHNNGRYGVSQPAQFYRTESNTSHMIDSRRYASILIVMIILLISALFSGCDNSNLMIKGAVEQLVVSHYAESSGKIISSPVEQGAPVKAGDILAVIDTSQEEFALEQLKAVLERRQATLDELLAGADSNELNAVQNAIKLAQESYRTALLNKEKADQELEDAMYLYANDALNLQTINNLTHQAELARSAVESAKLQIDTARNQYESLADGASVYKITMANADITQTESQIRQSEDRIAKATIRALADGILITKNYYSGDMAAPGYNLADIADENSKYVLAYWPADRLSEINYGQTMTVTAGDDVYKGTVIFIDVSKEYTPKEDQTPANKNKSSMRIKVKLPEDTPLKQGEEVFLSY